MNPLYRIITSCAASCATVCFAQPAMANKLPVQVIVSNNNSTTDTKIATLHKHSVNQTWWQGPNYIADPVTVQKTIGASPSKTVIAFRQPNNILYIIDGSITYGMGQWTTNLQASNEQAVLRLDEQDGFKFIPEEIELNPDNDDIFVLGSQNGGNSAKQIIRVSKTNSMTNSYVAHPMSINNSWAVMSPNGFRAFVNPTIYGYKSGSIAVIPNPAGGQLLIFSHLSTKYNLCHWVFQIGTGADENKLLSRTDLHQCNKSTPWGSLTSGINTVYIGAQTASSSGGLIAPRFLFGANNGSLYEIPASIFTTPNSTYPAATSFTNGPSGPVNMQNDFAWVRNYTHM